VDYHGAQSQLSAAHAIMPGLQAIHKQGRGIMSTRETTTFGLWKQVNDIACGSEDHMEIRKLIAEAGIPPGIHVGLDPAEFTPLITAEWVLGQWATVIDNPDALWMLNSTRNISLHYYDKVFENQPLQEEE
jgi:hypothetical protein